MAKAQHVPVTLQSAPDALLYAGALYLLQMYVQEKEAFPEVEARFILDCGKAGAEAVTAMRIGHTHIRTHAPEPLRDKLLDIAAQLGVTVMDEQLNIDTKRVMHNS